MPISLDYSLESTKDRLALVNQIIEEAEQNKISLSNTYLEILSNYLIFNITKEERKEKKIISDNRWATVNKREVSLEEAAQSAEEHNTSLYNLIKNDKNIIFKPKDSITKKDLEEIPYLRQITESIEHYQKLLPKSSGKEKFIIKKSIIELQKDRYVVRNYFRNPTICTSIARPYHLHQLPYDESPVIVQGKRLEVRPSNPAGISLLNPKHILALLNNYAKIKMDTAEDNQNDLKYLLQDFEDLVDRALLDYPEYKTILILKIDNKKGEAIRDYILDNYGERHTVEYISWLWNNRIPKLIADQATVDYLYWYFTFKEKGVWKKCSRCGQIKLRDNRFFSRNSGGKDGFYSICKRCRNKKRR